MHKSIRVCGTCCCLSGSSPNLSLFRTHHLAYTHTGCIATPVSLCKEQRQHQSNMQPSDLSKAASKPSPQNSNTQIALHLTFCTSANTVPGRMPVPVPLQPTRRPLVITIIISRRRRQRHIIIKQRRRPPQRWQLQGWQRQRPVPIRMLGRPGAPQRLGHSLRRRRCCGRALCAPC